VRALIFDLDGTLVDTVYAHLFAWQRALSEAGDADRRLEDPSADRDLDELGLTP
jgi:beta-phosphoglucomutase-like phosphatase (HAD superfamily)